MSGHTPGPWLATGEVWSGSNQTLPAGILSYRINHKGQEETVAQVWPPYNCDYASKDYARHAADLRLMLAAPDLYCSLKELLEICRWKCSPLDEQLLPNKTNEQAMIDACYVLDRVRKI